MASRLSATIGGGGDHKHLPVVEPRGAEKSAAWHHGLRWLVVALALGAIGMYVASFFQTWWSFTLYAPQYPHGLRLAISLTGMGGDVHEIDMLNHYIGMGHLADAAKHERQLAGWGVGLIAVMVMALTLLAGKKTGKAMVIPGLAFPIVFLGDAFYWLHTFGHHLDPRAPLHIPPFTPQLFGNGQIGQFMTFAVPGPGFWMALVGLGLLTVAVVVRARVCADCRHRGECGALCPYALIAPPREKEMAP